eukprot:5388368-Prymnesium_polylepis.1
MWSRCSSRFFFPAMHAFVSATANGEGKAPVVAFSRSPMRALLLALLVAPAAGFGGLSYVRAPTQDAANIAGVGNHLSNEYIYGERQK